MIIPEFLITSLIIVLMPGTGVIYTLSTGLIRGGKASMVAALGCTLGIIPHLVASVLGLAAILHASAVAFQIFNWLVLATMVLTLATGIDYIIKNATLIKGMLK